MTTQNPPRPAEDERRGTLRGTVDGVRSVQLTTSQKLMVFVLSMSLFGLSNIILEIIPDPSIGPVDISVSYMVFVPLTIAALFSPFWRRSALPSARSSSPTCSWATSPASPRSRDSCRCSSPCSSPAP